MNLSRLPKCYQFVIGILTIISQVTNSIVVADYNDSISLANPTNYYDHALHILGRHRRQNTNTYQSCVIPNYPLNSIYEIITEPEVMYKPGDYVKKNSVLLISCEKGYKQPPYAPDTSRCLNGQWKDLPPACVRTCPSLKSTQSMSVKCIYNYNIPLGNCMHPVEGTTVRLSCNAFYEADYALKQHELRACKEGKWNPSLPECFPTCGLKSPKAQLNIINGRNVTRGDFPWHTGIYTNTMEYRCGGSIIHQNIIISAAHCLADDNGKKYSAENYLVAAGKYFNQYYDYRDQYAQYSSVRDIFIPEHYKKLNGFNSNDIAVVIMENPFTYTLGVQPVCIELNKKYENPNYLMNNNGIVTGWGYTDDRQVLSPVLKELIIPYVPYETCYNQVPPSFRRFITSDKICGGFLNQGTSVCQGDSGGGLVYNVDNHYFIKGIVSSSPASTESGVKTCDSQQYGLYTSIKYHADFISNYKAIYSWRENIECVRDNCANEDIENRESCRLPNFPQHGKYSFPDNNLEYKSGNNVPTYAKVLLSCDTGYVANPPELYCQGNGQWTPTVGTCEVLAFQTTDGQFANNQDGQEQNVQNQNQGANFSPSSNTQEDLALESRFHYFDLQMLLLFNENENYFISPASIKMTLAMLLEGSRGKCAQEISKILRIPIDVNSSRAKLNSLLNNLSTRTRTTVLNSANLVAISNKYTVLQRYREILQEHYKAQIIPVNYRNSVSSATLINNWVKETTSDLVSEIISAENFNDEASLVIGNALFFKAQWKTAFEKQDSYSFETHPGTYLPLVQTMQVSSQFRYRYVEELDAQAVELPYSDGECAMLILLPSKRHTVDGLQVDLQHYSFAAIIDSLEQTEMLVSLPKFDIEYSTDLGPTLESMGIKEIFSENANLTGIVEADEVRVSNIFHKAKVEVNEKAAPAAAVTGAIKVPSETFIANRPFLFFIYNVHNKNILFEGRLNKPFEVTITTVIPSRYSHNQLPNNAERIEEKVVIWDPQLFSSKDVCTIPAPKMNGVCKLISLCPSAQEALATKGIFPTTCGFKDDEPIVCCADSFVTDPTANGKTSKRNTVPITPSKTTQAVGEKSKQKCKEYGKYVFEPSGIVPIAGRPPIPAWSNCAVTEIEIIGGTPAKSKEFPHMALVGFQEEGTNEIHWHCGGSLISEKFVLSAGHCTFHRTYQEPKYILLGELVLDNTTDDAKPQQISIKNIITHPEFLSPSRYNDIALFELEREADLGGYTRPACLNTSPSLTDKLGIASGWGQNASSGPTSKEMQKVSFDMFENSHCNRTFGRKVSRELAHGVVETQLCAGFLKEPKGTCHGDSGGPLQVVNSKEVFCTYSIIGITSIGKNCSIRGIPAVYTRVSSYIEWIENIVWPS